MHTLGIVLRSSQTDNWRFKIVDNIVQNKVQCTCIFYVYLQPTYILYILQWHGEHSSKLANSRIKFWVGSLSSTTILETLRKMGEVEKDYFPAVNISLTTPLYVPISIVYGKFYFHNHNNVKLTNYWQTLQQ